MRAANSKFYRLRRSRIKEAERKTKEEEGRRNIKKNDAGANAETAVWSGIRRAGVGQRASFALVRRSE